MTHRTRTTLPSTRAPTRNATFGSRKSDSLDSTPRIHQGLAFAAPMRPNSSRARIDRARVDVFMGLLYPSRAPSGPERAFLVRYGKNTVTQPLNRPNQSL